MQREVLISVAWLIGVFDDKAHLKPGLHQIADALRVCHSLEVEDAAQLVWGTIDSYLNQADL